MGPTTLDFGRPCDDFEGLWVFDIGLDAWIATHGVTPAHLAVWSGPEFTGYESPTRVGGVVVHDAETVLGIRAWDDAYEGLMSRSDGGHSVPWVLFDLEKIVRMMLRQSGLAFEILASPSRASSDDLEGELIPAHAIVEAAIHEGILCHYRDCADSVAWSHAGVDSREYRLQAVDAVRCALTGLELIEGRVEFHLDRLLERNEQDVVDAVRTLLADDGPFEAAHELLRDRVSSWCQCLDAPGETALGERPDDYDWLNDLVVEQRLKRRHS